MRSISKPRRTVSFISLSNGKEGVPVSSKEKLCQVGLAGSDASLTLPITPMSDDVLSPITMIASAGSHLRRIMMNEPGERRPGRFMYGVFNLISVMVFALESSEIMK